MDLYPLVSQLYVINGSRQPTKVVPGLTMQVAPKYAAKIRKDDKLFIHLSLSGSPEISQTLADQLLAIITEKYFSSTSSITSAMRAAINEANRYLLQYNVTSTEVKYDGAISCCILRNDEFYMAQAGEAYALLNRNFGIERFPDHTTSYTPPMGRTASVDIRYFHQTVQLGEKLLFVDPRLGHHDSQTFKTVLSIETLAELNEGLQDIIDDDTARLLLVELTDKDPLALTQVAPATKSRRFGRVRKQAKPAPVVEETVLSPRVDVPQERPISSPSPSSPPSRIPRKPNIPQPVEQPTRAMPAQSVMPNAPRKATASAVRGLARFTGGLSEFLTRLWTPSRSEMNGNIGTNVFLPAFLVLLVAVSIGLIGANSYVNRQEQQRMQAFRAYMKETLDVAEVENNDLGLKKAQLLRVLETGKQAELLVTEDSQIVSMRDRANNLLDQLDGMTRLQPTLLYDYSGEDSLIKAVVADTNEPVLYTMDVFTDTVYRHDALDPLYNLGDEQPTQIFNKGGVGVSGTNELIDMIWEDNSNPQERTLSVLDKDGSLHRYFPASNSKNDFNLPNANEWETPKSLTTYSGNIYVLDDKAIFRYQRTQDGFTIEPNRRFLSYGVEEDINLVRDFELSEIDANQILLYSDGRIRANEEGGTVWSESNLTKNGITPLSTPTQLRIIGKGLDGTLYILDGGNGRLLHTSLTGKRLEQFKASVTDGTDLFAEATSFDVLEDPLRIFVTTNNKLYMLTKN